MGPIIWENLFWIMHLWIHYPKENDILLPMEGFDDDKLEEDIVANDPEEELATSLSISGL